MSNPEGHNQFTAGQVVRFAGKSADGKVIGAMDVKIINPHSNADQVGHTEGKGSKAREYNKDGSRHIPTATVERPAQSDRPAKQFEAHHFALSAISQKGINMSPYQDASPLTEMKKALSTTGLVSMAGSLQKSNPEGINQYTSHLLEHGKMHRDDPRYPPALQSKTIGGQKVYEVRNAGSVLTPEERIAHATYQHDQAADQAGQKRLATSTGTWSQKSAANSHNANIKDAKAQMSAWKNEIASAKSALKGVGMYQDPSPLTDNDLSKSNPEGHNQYTGGGAKSQAHHILRQSDIMSAGLKITEDSAHPSALMNAQQDAMTSSSQAHSASANAMNTSNEDSEAAQNHINAANAHKEAAKDQTKAASMSRNAGDKKAAATHEKLASESKTLAAFHSDQAKSTKKSK